MKTTWLSVALVVGGCAVQAEKSNGSADMSAAVAKDPACTRTHYDTKACSSVSDCFDGPEYNCFQDVDSYTACGCVSDGGCGAGFRCTVQSKSGEVVEYPGICVPTACH